MLTGSISRFAKSAAGRPPSARPRRWTTETSLAVPSRRWSQYPFGEALSEDLAAAQDAIAPEAAGDYQELYDPPRERQIGHASPIPAMHNCSARWTQANASGRPDRNNGLITFIALSTTNPRGTRDWSGGVLAAWR